jgi:D-alanyl-D-alanine carboxypeptidase (penicillin-binding protein 5/6)
MPVSQPDFKKIIIINFVIFVIISLIAFIYLSFPFQNNFAIVKITESPMPTPTIPSPTPTPTPIPMNIKNVLPPELSAEGIYIVDVTTHTVLYGKNIDLQLFPASTTKIMTAIVALEDYKLDNIVTIKDPLKEGRIMGLNSNETISVENLLYATLIHSANDAAYALAQYHEGGIDGFVARMNQKAQEFNLTQTHFTNSVGLDDPNHFTTPKDLANLSLEALKNPMILKMVAIPQITVSDTTYTYFHPLKNVNELLGKIPGVSGLKSGYTDIAGQALVTTVNRNGHEVLIVLLKSVDRFGETEKLINWIFNNFTWQ